MAGDRVGWTIGELVATHGGEIKTGPFGTKLKASEYTGCGVPLISVREVGQGWIELHKDTPRVDESVTSRMPEYILRTGDIVFGRKGAVERSARIRSDQDGWFLGSDGIRLRLPPICDSTFMSYQMMTPAHRAWMVQHAAGTTMPSLNQGIIERIPIVLPPLEEQRAIGEVLSSFDNKIELNRRMNRTLEAMARTIFKAWFVDFEPVKAKAAGAASFRGMPQDIFDQLPDRFTETELGPVPEGWNVRDVKSACAFNYGKALKAADRRGGGVPVYGSNGVVGWHDEAIVAGPGIVVGRKGNPGTVIWVQTDFFPIDTTFYATTDHADVRLSYLRYALQHLRLDTFGSDSAVPGLNRNMAYGLPMVIPNKAATASFDDLFQSFQSLIHLNERESRTLASIRDVLLPKLISGELIVPNVEGDADGE